MPYVSKLGQGEGVLEEQKGVATCPTCLTVSLLSLNKHRGGGLGAYQDVLSPLSLGSSPYLWVVAICFLCELSLLPISQDCFIKAILWRLSAAPFIPPFSL